MNGLWQRVALCLVVLISTSGYNAGKSIEELKKARDVRGLVAKLDDPHANVRREAAIALPGVVETVNDPDTLKRIIGPLTEARLRDPWKTTRDYSGRALMKVLSKRADQSVLANTVSPFLDVLAANEVETDRRRFAAVALSGVVNKLENADVLKSRISDLLSATFDDPDEQVREYAGRALQYGLQKLEHQPTLIPAARALAAQLGSKDLRARRYSSVRLSGLVSKITDQKTLKSLLGPLGFAASKDRDDQVREYAGRAVHHIKAALEVKKAAAPSGRKGATKVRSCPPPARSSKKANLPKVKPAKSVDLQTLTTRLKAGKPEERLEAAGALLNSLKETHRQSDLQRAVPPLLAAALNDPDGEVREHSRLALRQGLEAVEDEAVLSRVAQSYLEGLKHKDDKVRAHCAHDLSRLVGKIDDQSALGRLVGPLTAATLDSESMDASDFPGFALREALRKLDQERLLIR